MSEWKAKNPTRMAGYREKAKRRYVEEVEAISNKSRLRYLKHREERQEKRKVMPFVKTYFGGKQKAINIIFCVKV